MSGEESPATGPAASAGAASTPRSPGGILLLSAAGFFGIFSTTMSKSPVLPLFVASLNATETVIGLIAAVSPLAGVFFSFPVGILADRWGKKRLLLISAVVLLTAPILYLFVDNAFWLIPIRFFHGIATAILTPVASAFILGAYPESKGEKLGLFSSATLAGRTLAPLLGGVFITLFMFMGGSLPYRAVYVGALLLAVPAFFLILALEGDDTRAGQETASAGSAGSRPSAVTPRSPKVTFSGGVFLRGLRDFLRNRRLLGTSLVEMGTYFAYGTLETYLPLYLASLGIPAYEIGLVFSLQVLSIALTKPLFGRLADRVDRRLQVLAGIALLAVATSIIPWFTSVIVLIAVSVVFGLAVSISTVATSSYVAEVEKKENIGASIGALSSIMDVGHSSGPFVAGIVITAVNVAAGFYTAGAACVLAVVLFCALVRPFKPMQR